MLVLHYVLVCLLCPSADAGGGYAVRQACESTKGQGYEVAYEIYRRPLLTAA